MMIMKNAYKFQALLALVGAVTACSGAPSSTENQGESSEALTATAEVAVDKWLLQTAPSEQALLPTQYGNKMLWYKVVGPYGILDGDIVLGDINELRQH